MLFQVLLSKCRPVSSGVFIEVKSLSEWNDLMDEAFSNPAEYFDYERMKNESFSSECSSLFIQAKAALLETLFNTKATTALGRLFDSNSSVDSSTYDHLSVESTMRRVQARVDVPTKLDIELVRCVQNLMRWYIQIVLRKGDQQLVDALEPCKEVGMLELCLKLMEIPDLGRFPSQLFFYTTFRALPHDQGLIDAMGVLVARHRLADRLLTTLAQTSLTEQRWLLSLVRNVHNAVAGFPEQCLRQFEQTSVAVESEWARDNDGRCTYASTLRELGISILKTNDNLSDLSAELAVEILRCCFALRFGCKLLEERWREFIELSLNNENILCQNAGVGVLVDAPTQYPLDAVTMLRIVDRQIRDTDSGLIEDSDAASIIPILAVLHKFCVANLEFRRSMRAGIFNNEPNYQLALKREIEKNGHVPARNSKPLDAPKGSLRSNLICLMCCPHSVVKRLAGEVLWSLLDGDKDEYVRRVGLGNALPFLSAKGLATLPA